MSLNTNIEWPIQWPNLIVSGDHYLNDRRGTHILDIGVGFHLSHILVQNSSVCASAYNPGMILLRMEQNLGKSSVHLI